MDRLNDTQVKNLNGNDRLRARRMGSFDPSHTLAMVSNKLPTIQGRYAPQRRKPPVL
jgi:phage/plasmid-associated DNA primase